MKRTDVTDVTVRRLGQYHARMLPLTRVQFLDHFGLSIDDMIADGTTARLAHGTYLRARLHERHNEADVEQAPPAV